MNPELAHRIGALALEGVVRTYPYQPGHAWLGPHDGTPPDELHPIFAGCYDWHSAVHAHWSLARLINRGLLEAPIASKAHHRLVTSITPDRVAIEQAYFEHPARRGFEWPYGWAWLLQLTAELRSSADDALRQAGEALLPLANLLADRVGPRLARQIAPIRTGTHRNTAFAMGLFWDAAPGCGRPDLRAVVAQHAERFYGGDVAYPWAYEPSAYDFLSPGLQAIGIMRRVQAAAAFDAWLEAYGPPTSQDLAPVHDLDPSDGWLAHLVGLDLSRSWELTALAAHCPHHPQVEDFRALGAAHWMAAEGALFSGHYEGDHWLGTFALYGATLGDAPST